MVAEAVHLNLYERMQEAEEGPEGFFEAFSLWVMDQGLELYPAQEEAILELLTGQHVILKTPTGSGKSMVATALHGLALSKGVRTVYTSPIKALVNEKFLALCEIFGAAQVGMATGDTGVNQDAPILCCTAEILANMALREGAALGPVYVAMDEFHYYGDRDRGWAWQLPLLILEEATFLLMSATLGDTREIEGSLEEITGREVSSVVSHERPVPLEFSWSEDPLHDAISKAVKSDKAPIYLVNFSQREAAEAAQSLMSQDFTPREDKKAISDEMNARLFDTPYGQVLQRYLRHGVGLHHGGLLPKYRLLVEKLARMGLLRVIAGTDTLGVGVNIPIRTVLFTKLCKYDGEATKILTVRDFQQIAGRAGRRGFDTRGYVTAQAPAHLIENKRLAAQAALKGRKKFVRAQPPKRGFVPWSESTFEELIAGQPEPLASSFQVSHAMLIEIIQRPNNAYRKGGGPKQLIELIDKSHTRPYEKTQLRRQFREVFQSLVRADLLQFRPSEYFRAREVYVRENLQTDFSLMQALGLFLVEAIETLDKEHPEYALDVLSFVEAVIENPMNILLRQLDKLKGELLAAWKEEGIEYEERMERLAQVSWPKPKAELLYQLFETYEQGHPWVKGHPLRPKSIMRDMAERYMSFNEYVKELGLERIEGTLLRYLSEGFKTLVHTVPVRARTDELVDLIAFFRNALARVDSSLIQEWERLMYGAEVEDFDREHERVVLDITRDKRAFRARVRTELHALVKALHQGDFEEFCLLIAEDDDRWEPDRVAEHLAPFEEAYARVAFDHRARLADKTEIVQDGPHEFTVRQLLLAHGIAEEEAELWVLEGEIDLREDTNPEGGMVRVRYLGPA